MDSAWALVLLGLIAAASVVQATFLIALAMESRRFAARLDGVERDVRPHLERMGDVIENVAQLTAGAARRLPQIESTVEDTLHKLRRTTDLVETLALKPLQPVAKALALWRGLRRGAEVYRAIGAGRRP